MKIISINTGSSSLKFQVYEMPEEKVLISGNFERIKEPGSFYSIIIDGNKKTKELSLKNHKDAFDALIKELIENNIVSSFDEIKGVGHRVVQGGDYFKESVVIEGDVISKIEDFSSLAPLHNPAAITGIKASIETIPESIQVAVFDTAFHQTMKEEVYLYALPYSWYTDHKIRRYGAHGTSHKFVTDRINEILGRTDTKLIICHLGSGASISAVKDGKCINTSMGLTPNAGLIMGTRCGDIDATIVTHMMRKTNMSLNEIENVLNKESGYLGISGVGNDSRDIEDGMDKGNERCILARKMFVNRVVEYISKYYVELSGCDAICFTAGIGEKSPRTRNDILLALEVLGVELDKELNELKGMETLITKPTSKIAAYVIPTNEELMIARDTYNLIK